MALKKFPRSDFIAIDRHQLAYLNVIEKVNCAYCGYANGVAAYFREVAARTEEYWCPIKARQKGEKSPFKISQVRRVWRCVTGFRERIE